jgi:hypothetical protein
VTPGLFRKGQVRSGYVWSRLVRLGKVMLTQVSTGYTRLGQDGSGKDRLHLVSSGKVWLGQVTPV